MARTPKKSAPIKKASSAYQIRIFANQFVSRSGLALITWRKFVPFHHFYFMRLFVLFVMNGFINSRYCTRFALFWHRCAPELNTLPVFFVSSSVMARGAPPRKDADDFVSVDVFPIGVSDRDHRHAIDRADRLPMALTRLDAVEPAEGEGTSKDPGRQSRSSDPASRGGSGPVRSRVQSTPSFVELQIGHSLDEDQACDRGQAQMPGLRPHID